MTRNRLHQYSRLSLISAGSAMLASWVLLFGYFWHFEREETLENLIVQTRLISANITAAVVFEDERTATEIIATLEDAPEVMEAAVYRRDGRPLARYQRGTVTPLLPARAPAVGHEFALDELRVTLPVVLERQAVGTISTRITLRGFYQLALWFATGMLGATLLAVAVAHQAGRRLRQRMEAAEREVEFATLRDPVTGLANRQAFERTLAQALDRHARNGGGSALLYIHVDDLARINDRQGQALGDALLTHVALRLRDTLRGADAIARIGGGEFGVILANTAAPDDVIRVVETLLKAAAQPMDADGVTLRPGLAIGIAMLPADGKTLETAMRHANQAMRHARKIAKDRYQFFSVAIDNAPALRQRVDADLRVALRGGELYIAYQPQRFARSGRIAGLEALVRWRHPERGIVSPSDFIPIAEESGLIGDVGRAVIDLVCRDIVELRGAGRVVPPVAINVSRLQLDDALIGDLDTALRKYGLAPDMIELELSAHAIGKHIDGHAVILAGLAALGVRLSLDDFDGDAALLRAVAATPFSRLKIDMGLIRELPENTAMLARITDIIAAGHAAGLRLIAEGVESSVQAEALTEAGCDLLQGYHLGLPVRKQEIQIFLDQD